MIGPAVIQPMSRGGTGGNGNRRPSRDERNLDRLKKEKLKGVSKAGNTRKSKLALNDVARLMGADPEDVKNQLIEEAMRNTPPRTMGMLGLGDAIYSGKWRSFENDFAREWWDDQPNPWVCYLCNGVINPNGTGDQQPTIEHLKPWASIKLGIPTQTVCKDGVHWTVALTKHVRATLQDVDNLAPAHKGCNSSKNGPKDTDSIAPQKAGPCPGATCALPKAT